MKFCESIDQKEVFKKAINIVSSAKQEIFATMDVEEESVKPLPEAYHKLLKQKITYGIKVIRYGFGTKLTFKKLKKVYTNIDFYYAGIKGYQRMLIVDYNKGLFVINGQVFYSEFKPLLKSLVKFVKTVYNRRNYVRS